MLEHFKNKVFEYTKLTEEEQLKRGILGRLVGPIADAKKPTRNDRDYTQCWDKVFDDPIVLEKLENRCFVGEFGHPADRQEVEPEKIAICLAEKPKRGDDGLIYGVFDILNTPNGKILKALCDYGCKIGVSSRGTGDVYTDENGIDVVDADTFNCECWDAVLIPAVKEARMNYVTESLQQKASLKQTLKEELDKASIDDRKIMLETLQDLGINTNNGDNIVAQSTTESNCATENSINEPLKESTEANNNGTAELIKSLQEALKESSELKTKIMNLQEQLAVRDTKVNELNEEISRYKSATIRLSSLANNSKEVSKEVSSLKESIEAKDKQIKLLEKRNSALKAECKNVVKLNESVATKTNENSKLSEQLNSQKTEYETKIKEIKYSLQESFDNSTKELNEKLQQTNAKIKKMSNIAEGYKKLAEGTVKRYIESKAVMIGVTSDEVKNKLPESYSLDDIDRVCESLQTYNLNISKLPFDVKRMKVNVNQPKENIMKYSSQEKVLGDDDVDDVLIKMANLDK